jgi:hypothetical protein
VRFSLVVVCGLAGVTVALSQALSGDWSFGERKPADPRGIPTENYRGPDFTLQPWPADSGTASYLGRCTGASRPAFDFAPSFRGISSLEADRADPAEAVAPVQRRTAITYRYDKRRGKFTVRRGFRSGFGS